MNPYIPKQVIDQKYCNHCDICCRFGCKDSFLRPIFSDEEITQIKKQRFNFNFTKSDCFSGNYIELINLSDGFCCPFFLNSENACRIYDSRPLDCRIYPFILMFDKQEQRVLLGADPRCPYINDNLSKDALKKYVVSLKMFFQSKDFIDVLTKCPSLINRFQEDVFIFGELEILTNFLTDHPLVPFKRLSILDKTIFEEHLSKQSYEISSLSFANIIIWSSLFNFYWLMIHSNLCLFAEQDGNYFMYLPPLSKNIDEKSIFESFKIMNILNKNKDVSRIENCQEEIINFFKETGVKAVLKEIEYVCDLQDIVHLKGNKFKSKRWAYNYFIKNYNYVLREYCQKDKEECLDLYRNWQDARRKKFSNLYYQATISDTYLALKKALEESDMINLIGRVVRINKRICGFIFGYKLNEDTICVAFETTDLSKKGLSQFIFRELAKEFLDSNLYNYFNIMGDSGLENIKKAKLSWHPKKTLTAHIISTPQK